MPMGLGRGFVALAGGGAISALCAGKCRREFEGQRCQLPRRIAAAQTA